MRLWIVFFYYFLCLIGSSAQETVHINSTENLIDYFAKQNRTGDQLILTAPEYQLSSTISVHYSTTITATNSSFRCVVAELAAISIEASATISITGVNFESCYNGVELYSSANNSITSCTFQNITSTSIQLYNASLTLVNSSFFNSGMAINASQNSAVEIVGGESDGKGERSTSWVHADEDSNVTATNVIVHSHSSVSCLVSNSRYLSLTNVTFIYNMQGVSLVNVTYTIISDCQFLDNGRNVSEGAAIKADLGREIRISSSKFRNNYASYYGGAIWITESYLVLSDSVVADNYAVEYGGGFYLSNVTAKINNTSFRNNTAADGGGMYAVASKLELLSTNFTSNTYPSFFNSTTGSGKGGGMWINLSSVSVLDCNWQNNNAMDDGGGLYVANSSLELLDSQIFNNGALHGSGGGMSVSQSNVNLTHVSISYNSNGAIYVSSSSHLQMTSCTCNMNGGCVSLNSSTFLSNDSYFFNNTINSNGGAVYAASSNVTVLSSVFVNNAATYGGAISFSRSTGFVSNCSIKNNGAMYAGGVEVVSSTVEIDLSEISYNTAFESAGGIWVEHANLYMLNNTIIGNVATENAAISLFGFVMIIRQTIIDAPNSGLIQDFCCNGFRTNSPFSELCNFPACDNECLEMTNNCDCPFNSSQPNLNFPVYTNASYACTCLDQDYTGVFCGTENNNCSPACENSTCSHTNGTFTCICDEGYEEINGSCEAPSISIDKCSVNNGGCDYHVECVEQNGIVLCGDCPIGYQGNSNSTGGCKSQCGNSICETLFENCVTCSADCREKSCEICGDGACDANESCNSCYIDCGPCARNCPPCSSHGTCSSDNICVCQGAWTGPYCNVTTVPIVISTNETNPVVDIHENNSSIESQISVKVGVRTLTERDISGTLIYSVDLNSVNFSVSRPPFPVSPTTNEQWMYYAQLNNFAIVNITFIQFNDQLTTYNFHNETSTFAANTLKLNIRVQNWPFKSYQNILQVELENAVEAGNNGNDKCGSSANSQSDESMNLQWLKITLNGVAVYAQFVSEAFVDDKIRTGIKFELMSNSSVVATLPHFWDYADLDPNYSVLIDPFSAENCDGELKKSSKSSHLVVEIVVPVVIGIAILTAILYTVVRSYQRKQAHQRLVNSISMTSVSREGSESKMNIERFQPMQTTTAAGTFRVEL